MCKKCAVCTIAVVLVLIGALNWGLVGIGMFMGQNWNVVNMLLGQWMQVEAIVYILVGVAALWKIFMMKKCCGKCEKCGGCKMMGKCEKCDKGM